MTISRTLSETPFSFRIAEQALFPNTPCAGFTANGIEANGIETNGIEANGLGTNGIGTINFETNIEEAGIVLDANSLSIKQLYIRTKE